MEFMPNFKLEDEKKKYDYEQLEWLTNIQNYK